MGEVSLIDIYAKNLVDHNSEVIRELWPPNRPGETTRTCPTCGEEFEPHSWNHKYCSKKCKLKN